MNNHRLLTGLVFVSLLSGVAFPHTRTVSIEELFEIAETNSIQLRPSFSAEQTAQKEIAVAKSHRLPEVNASLSLSYIGDGFTTKRNLSDFQRAPIPHFGSGLEINITQPIFSGGAISSEIKLAELKSTASRYETELNRDNIRFRIVGYYLDLYKCNNLRKVLESNLSRARLLLHEMKVRFEQGTALHNDITRYELLISNLELQLIKINNTFSILNNNLVVTAGLPEDTQIVPDSTILNRVLECQGNNWWVKEAESNSPLLKLARSNIDICKKSEDLVKSSRFPKIGLQASWSINGPVLVEIPPINRNLSYWFVGLGVSYDISSLYKSNRSLSQSKAATNHARLSYDAALENINLDINADYIRYIEAYEELKTQQKSVELAISNYQNTATRYSADMALITDMLDAADSQLDAEQKLVNASINIIYYYYKLLFISGKI